MPVRAGLFERKSEKTLARLSASRLGLGLVYVLTNVVITYIVEGSYERDKESARHPGGSGISGSAPYLRSALSRSCSVPEIRGSLANSIQCAPNPARRARRTAVRRDCEPDDYPRP